MIDIGANLTHKRFAKDLDQILQRSRQSGVEKIIVTGTDLESSTQALALCELHSGLYATVGVHPHDACSLDQAALESLQKLLAHPKAVAVGETGLDFNRNFSTPSQQIWAFERQIDIAISTQKALFLHERDAFEQQYIMLKKSRDSICGAVVHCFTGSADALQKYLELDLYIGITGWICDERRGTELQSLVKTIPDDRLLIETDAPYLTPRTLTGKKRKNKNEPANLGHIAEQIGKFRGQSSEQIIAISTANAKRLFRL
ncbi:MAG: YchF/TatD family DNA exonuclease [Pseudomonadales bacterium]|nr:YchF/TatD family DNA exonuclease [Pseudomonadales bacterium]NRA16173.1 YchF/TatD family DNA exonuclease [Oceanospirillaceae bacterium]